MLDKYQLLCDTFTEVSHSLLHWLQVPTMCHQLLLACLISVKLHLHACLPAVHAEPLSVTAAQPSLCNWRYVSVSFRIINPDSLNRARHG